MDEVEVPYLMKLFSIPINRGIIYVMEKLKKGEWIWESLKRQCLR